MSNKLRVVVLGMMGRSPFGGQTWLYLNWLRGLHRLGHEVFYVEDDLVWPYDPKQNTITSDCSYAVQHIAGRELVEPLGVPLRDDGSVRFVGGFYAQWEWMVTNLKYVGVPFLQRMLREEVAEGWTEFSCHPGYLSPDYKAVYSAEREAEVRTITDPRIRQTIEEQGIRLVSYADYLERLSR